MTRSIRQRADQWIRDGLEGATEREHQPDDRPERSTPYHLPHGYDTEEELAEFIQENQPEENEE